MDPDWSSRAHHFIHQAICIHKLLLFGDLHYTQNYSFTCCNAWYLYWHGTRTSKAISSKCFHYKTNDSLICLTTMNYLFDQLNTYTQHRRLNTSPQKTNILVHTLASESNTNKQYFNCLGEDFFSSRRSSHEPLGVSTVSLSSMSILLPNSLHFRIIYALFNHLISPRNMGTHTLLKFKVTR